MSETKGRASMDVRHHKTTGSRERLLRECMREIIEGESERQAKKNKNIVLEDEAKNKAYVNSGDGKLVRCHDYKEVLRYGDERVSRLARKRCDGTDYLCSTFVVHLPKNYCDEIPDFYEATTKVKDKETGEESYKTVKYSRYVAKDEKQAEAYFHDALAFVAENVIPGGVDAVLGIDIQFSETTPHMHIMADVYEDDPKRAGKLRNSHGRAYGKHRDVTIPVQKENGKVVNEQVLGETKLEKYHRDFKAYMISRGWEVEPEPDENSKEHNNKESYQQLKIWEALLEEREQNLDSAIAEHTQYFEEEKRQLNERKLNMENGEQDLAARQAEVERNLEAAIHNRRETEKDRAEAKKDREDARLEKENAVALSDKALNRLTHINQIGDTLENLHAKMKLPPERKTQGARIVSNARKVAASYKQEIEAEGGELAL